MFNRYHFLLLFFRYSFFFFRFFPPLNPIIRARLWITFCIRPSNPIFSNPIRLLTAGQRYFFFVASGFWYNLTFQKKVQNIFSLKKGVKHVNKFIESLTINNCLMAMFLGLLHRQKLLKKSNFESIFWILYFYRKMETVFDFIVSKLEHLQISQP